MEVRGKVSVEEARLMLADEITDDATKRAIAREISSRESAPSARHQSDAYRFYQEQLLESGTPYDVTRIPISVLKQMERDPMISFGLHFIRTPIMRARWYIQADDARVAAFIDNALRPILPSLIFQYTGAWNYGFKPIVKRFAFINPEWTYLDPLRSDDPLPVWENGSIEAIIWKTFVPLPSDPSVVEPMWSAKGEFDGINYNGGTLPGAFQFPLSPDENEQEGVKRVPLRKSLWFTNEKYTGANGSIYGYPKVGYAFRPWWSSWFRWALYDRFFERKADPPYVVYFPVGDDGDYVQMDETTVATNKSIALSIAEAARSGGGIAMPGRTITGFEDRPTTIREWEIKELEVKGDMTHFVESFEYLDVMKLRCVTGDTPIDCPRDYEKYPDGIPISHLKEGQLIWCFNEDKEEFELRPVNKVAKTRPNAELLELTLDNGKKIKATPDHEFLLRNGEWVQLQELKPGDALMPLEKDFEPFVKTRPNERGWQRKPGQAREMDIVAESVYGPKQKNIHTHHIDERHINTSPENLQYLTNAEHTKITNEGKRRSPDWYKKVKSGYSQRECIDCSDLFNPRGPTSKRCDKCQADHRYKKATEKIFDINLSNRKSKTCEDCGDSYIPSGNAQKWCAECRTKNWLESKSNPISKDEWVTSLSNHKVISVTPVPNEDTYDLSVDGPSECHSFVSNGIVLHNSLWVPEQAFLEGKGGTSSRNVASEEIGIHKEGVANEADAFDEHINRYVIPDLVAANFPDYKGECRKITTGFTDADQKTLDTILQLVGQSDPAEILRNVNMRGIVDRLGLPLISEEVIRDRDKKVQEEIDKLPPPVVPEAGGPAGVTQEGFYVQAPSIITLADDSDFIATLPNSRHYSDKRVLSSTRQLRTRWKQSYADIYSDFVDYISKKNVKLDEADEKAEDIVNRWAYSRAKLSALVSDTQNIVKRVMTRAGQLESERADLGTDWSADNEAIAEYLEDRGALYVKAVDETVREELRVFLANAIREGLSQEELIAQTREHFADFPDWKANRLVRSEIRDAYNFAMLSAGAEGGIKVVQALDAQHGQTDHDCEEREGKFFTIGRALSETLKEHPNGTLEWVFTDRENLSIQDSEDEDKLAYFDEQTSTIYLNKNLPAYRKTEYLMALGEQFAL